MVNHETLRSPVKFCTVKLSEVVAKGMRLEASTFNLEAKQTRDIIEHGKYSSLPLIGENSPVKKAYYGARLKRNYVDSTYPNAVGFIGSSEMLDCYPHPIKFMKKKTNDLSVKYGDILISRSGTIGNITLVSRTLEKLLISEHAIRLECDNYFGYTYAFLMSKMGQILIQSNIYGAVIKEIEPEHLETIPIPNAPLQIKKRINDLIIKSYDLRDEANLLVDKATAILLGELHFPKICNFEEVVYNKNKVNTFSVKLSDLEGRLDASYHIPIVNAIIEHMKKYAGEVTKVGDKRVSKKIILPGRFKRFYVEEGQGKIFIGGKQIGELNPTNKKYLSLTHHADRINNQLTLHEKMTLITCSGTIGKVSLVSKHWENWTASQHIIRIIPANDDIAGYLNIFLASDYGHQLITRHTYGSVVNEIDDTHVSNIPFPILKNKNIQKQINDIALKANEKKYEAYKKEKEALKIMEEEVLVKDGGITKNEDC